MKKLFFLLLAATMALNSSSQTTIIGDNQCISPYCGCDVIQIQRAGVPAGEWVEAIIPTNIVFTTAEGTQITTQHWAASDTDVSNGWRQADGSGVVTFEFNATLTDAVVSATIANGYFLPAGDYIITTRYASDKSGVSAQSVGFKIVGNTTAAILAAAKNKKKGHQAKSLQIVK